MDASGVVFVWVAGLRVAVRRAGVRDEGCAADVVDDLAGERRGVLVLVAPGLAVVFSGVGVVAAPDVVSALAWSGAAEFVAA